MLNIGSAGVGLKRASYTKPLERKEQLKLFANIGKRDAPLSGRRSKIRRAI